MIKQLTVKNVNRLSLLVGNKFVAHGKNNSFNSNKKQALIICSLTLFTINIYKLIKSCFEFMTVIPK